MRLQGNTTVFGSLHLAMFAAETGMMLGKLLTWLSFGCAVLLALCPSIADAGGPVVVITDKGYQVMTVGADGNAVLAPAQVVDLRGTSPTPTPPPTGTLSPTATRVKDLAAAVNDPEGAQALAVVYREVGRAAAGGKMTREQVMTALRMASDDVLNATKTSAKWAAWRASVSTMITESEVAGPVDYSAFCVEVAKGLEASSPQGALTPELLQLIIELVLKIISLFTGGGGGV